MLVLGQPFVQCAIWTVCPCRSGGGQKAGNRLHTDSDCEAQDGQASEDVLDQVWPSGAKQSFGLPRVGVVVRGTRYSGSAISQLPPDCPCTGNLQRHGGSTLVLVVVGGGKRVLEVSHGRTCLRLCKAACAEDEAPMFEHEETTSKRDKSCQHDCTHSERLESLFPCLDRSQPGQVDTMTVHGEAPLSPHHRLL